MKKVYLILLLLFATGTGSCCYSQSTTSNLGAGSTGNWADVTTGQVVTATSWDNGQPGAGDTITISLNETIFIDKKITISGAPVHLIIKGTLAFKTAGQLILPAGSTIEVESSGDVTAEVGNQSQVLQIGEVAIKSEDIDAITGPASINESNLACGGCAPQPVTLLYFKATAQAQLVEVKWAASKAWDFSHYELERSRNGKDFEKVATLDAEENTDFLTEFIYTDRKPLSGISYYRLKAIDMDGKFEYKGLAVVQFMGKNFEVYPNPITNGVLHVNGLQAAEGARLLLRDNAGRTVRSLHMSGKEEHISTEGLPTGVYILLIQSPQQTFQSQVLIR